MVRLISDFSRNFKQKHFFFFITFFYTADMESAGGAQETHYLKKNRSSDAILAASLTRLQSSRISAVADQGLCEKGLKERKKNTLRRRCSQMLIISRGKKEDLHWLIFKIKVAYQCRLLKDGLPIFLLRTSVDFDRMLLPRRN